LVGSSFHFTLVMLNCVTHIKFQITPITTRSNGLRSTGIVWRLKPGFLSGSCLWWPAFIEVSVPEPRHTNS
jgi:hypothetical protein